MGEVTLTPRGMHFIFDFSSANRFPYGEYLACFNDIYSCLLCVDVIHEGDQTQRVVRGFHILYKGCFVQEAFGLQMSKGSL